MTEPLQPLQQLVEWVKTASPVLWQAAYRQVYVNGIEEIIGIVFFAALAFFGLSRVRENWDEWDEVVVFFAVLGVLVSFIISFAFLFGAIDDFANPTFQAVKNLAGLVKKE